MYPKRILCGWLGISPIPECNLTLFCSVISNTVLPCDFHQRLPFRDNQGPLGASRLLEVILSSLFQMLNSNRWSIYRVSAIVAGSASLNCVDSAHQKKIYVDRRKRGLPACLFYVILFHFILSRFISFYFIIFYLLLILRNQRYQKILG